ncbi:hypothetical protein B566_EDAN007660 [Ephemera danica]|nr:hypothetical protein B566_EDAN007660 [Ephemera danica]
MHGHDARINKEPGYFKVLSKLLDWLESAQIDDLTAVQMIKKKCYSLVDAEYNEHIPRKMNAKDSASSVKLRQSGNSAFTAKDYAEAHKFFTESIAIAPENSTELALAFANRSAVLLATGRFIQCITDIHRALSIMEYPQNLHYKLYLRLGQAYRELGNGITAAEGFKQASDLVDKMQLSEEKKNDLQQVIDKERNAGKVIAANKEVYHDSPISEVNYGANKNAPCFSSGVDIQLNKERGRDVLLVEEPFAIVRKAEFRATHCYYCFKRCYNMIPCPNCPYALYCNEQCKTSAYQEFHRVECPVVLEFLAIDKTLDFCNIYFLIVRIILGIGMDKWVDYLNEQQQISTQPIPGFDCDGKYTPKGLSGLYNLYSEVKPRGSMEILMDTLVVFLLMKCFHMEVNDPNYDVIALSFLKLIFSMNYNCCGHAVSTFIGHDSEQPQVDWVGCTINLSFSMINHSCNRNARSYFNGTTLIVRALEPISKGKEVTVSYHAIYPLKSKKDRQFQLQMDYKFRCECEACIENWPTIMELPMDVENYRRMGQEENKVVKKFLKPKFKDVPRFLSEIDLNTRIKYATMLHKQGKFRTHHYELIKDAINAIYLTCNGYYFIPK